jgi:hypothetical protein
MPHGTIANECLSPSALGRFVNVDDCRAKFAPPSKFTADSRNIIDCIRCSAKSILSPEPDTSTKTGDVRVLGGDYFVRVHGGNSSVRKITFNIVDPDAPAGAVRSLERPDDHVYLAAVDRELEQLDEPNTIVAFARQIDVLYNFPLKTTGPTARERKFGGWLFTEIAPSGQTYFTRADLVRTIAHRYHNIYTEEAAASTVMPGYIPGTYSRVATNGPYGIYGHVLDDLALLAICWDAASNVWTLQLDA